MTGTTLEQLQVVIDAQTKPFREELSKMQAQMSSATADVEKKTSRIKGAFSGIGKVVAGLGIGYALFKMGKDALGYASNLTEVQNVVDTAFGSMSDKCEKFAKNSITQFGMSELSAKKTASTYMAMAKGIGMGAGAASDMAIDLAGFTGDISSFFNISQEEAGTKLKSIFTGETESLKDLGVVMTQTNLKQFAMSQGLSSNIESMDQASLTTLRYKFVTEQLAMAQGDFAKTSGTWANQVRILQEQWRQLLGIIGSGLIAVFTPIIQAINAAMSKIIQFAQVVQAVFSSLFGKKGGSPGKETQRIGANLGAAEDNAGGLNTQLDKTAGKANKAAKAMGQLASIDEINNMSTPSASDSGGSGGAVSGGGIDWGSSAEEGADEEPDTSRIDKMVTKVKEKLEELKKTIEKYKAPIVAAMAGIVAAVGSFIILKNIGAIGEIIGTLLSPLYKVFTVFKSFFGCIAGGQGIMAGLTAAFGAVNAPLIAIATVIGAVVAALAYLWVTSDSFRSNVIEAVNSIMGILKNIYDSILAPLFSFLADIFVTVLVPIAVFLADVFVTAVDLIASVVLTLWNKILAPLVNFLVDVLGMALQGVIDVWNAWKPAIEIIFAALNWIWDTVLKPIVEWIKEFFIKTFESWGDVIKELIPSVKKIFQGLIDFFVGIFSPDLAGCWKKVTEIFEKFDKFLTEVFSTDWTKNFGAFGEVLGGFFKNVENIWGSIKKVFSGIVDFIAGVFTGDWSRAISGVVTAFGGVFGGIVAVAKVPINLVIGLINGMISAIESGVNWVISSINKLSFKVPSWVPKIGGKHFGFDLDSVVLGRVQLLAKGGVVTAPTPAIFGEAGAEAVVPLENNTGWMAKIASGISGYMGFGTNEDIDDLITLIQELIGVVRDKDMSVFVGLDQDSLNESNRKSERLRKLRVG